jgi:uncharacterized protein (DUF111 family)
MEFKHHREHIDDDMLLVQANIDDMNPEYCSYISDRLFAQGANDVYWIPIIMKRGRPGVMLNLLVQKNKLDEMEQIIFTETTTLGLRYMDVSCHRLGRETRVVETPWGRIRVKAGFFQGEMVQWAPEFKDCEAIAKARQVPLKVIYEEVKRRFT